MTAPEPLAGAEYDGVAWERTDLSAADLARTTFSNCTFTGCNFSGLMLPDTRFEDCRLVDCNWSNTLIDHTRFDGAVFEGCKLVGLNFGNADMLTFGLSLTRCSLRYVNFSQVRWKKAVVSDCDVTESDFRGGKLVEADFSRSRFRQCRFHQADLTKADFRFADGYDLDPRTEVLKGAKFSLPEALNLLAPFGVEIG